MKKYRLDIGLQIPLLYLIFGGLWILFSDLVLDALVHNTEDMTRIQSYKGWAFVAVSSLLIFSLLRRYLLLQKKIENQLHQSEERLRLAVSAANQGIFDLNIQTGEIKVNDIYALMLGYDPLTFTEKISTWMDRMHPDDRASIEKAFSDYISRINPEYHVEFRQHTSSGNWKWILSIGKIVEFDTNNNPTRILGTFSDITETKKAEILRNKLLEDSQRRLGRITSLHEIDLEISSSSDLSATLKKIVLNVKNDLGVDAVAVLLYEDMQKLFTYADSIGFDSGRIKNARVKMGGSFAGIAAQQKKIVVFQQFADETVDEAFASLLAQERIVKYFGIALEAKGNLVGVLELFLRRDIDPDREWFEFYETLAGQVALAIDNARLVEGLEKVNRDLSKVNSDLKTANLNLTAAYDATIESLSMALSLRDYETEEHSRRVTTLILNLAQKMNFSSDDLINLRRGTLLHDIGKMGIPDAILRKPGFLTTDERLTMQQHPVFAYNLLKSIDYLKPALDIPHLHHEKWDGTGYPYGLRGEGIPLSARLFAIVDVYDALTSNRPYRSAWSKEDARIYIREQSGKHFDPTIVDEFLSFLDSHPEY